MARILILVSTSVRSLPAAPRTFYLLPCGYCIHVQTETAMQRLSGDFTWASVRARCRGNCCSEAEVSHSIFILMMYFLSRSLGERQAFTVLWETISTRGAEADWETVVAVLVLLVICTAISFNGINYRGIFSSSTESWLWLCAGFRLVTA